MVLDLTSGSVVLNEMAASEQRLDILIPQGAKG